MFLLLSSPKHKAIGEIKSPKELQCRQLSTYGTLAKADPSLQSQRGNVLGIQEAQSSPERRHPKMHALK